MTGEELKNCPNCGGILDDSGRCMYCNSKIYDLTDININFDTRDILRMKLKFNGQDVIMNCYPTNAEFETHPDYISYATDYTRKQYSSHPSMTIKLEMQSV